ncbi:PEGA domain-containing protein [Flavobacterium sp. K77]|uniref:PEGA domain-containing protein n=1 Tax=Flavobacterium turcicum TaxID=2764718 RepID=A0ABR7JG90_9FLAO|nr:MULTISPECIES: PEGA domain-containing protein [Flavobacterium]MBC5863320.1 PEGA domain-containing protein [Flavobacterium turcicum]MCF6140953.1 PEGA domain-containing protein [Flavobacterium sp. K77]NHL02052.1 PEGA domain-containing protein [Flavobacterium turcicum]
MKKSFISASLAFVLLCSSCATIVSGSKQNVKFESNPSQATILVDEVEVGKTPFEIKLSRKSEHEVLIKLDGYKNYQTTLTKKFNAWYLGNILIGGLVGLIIDPVTGAIYNLTPKQVNAEMTKGTAFNYKKGDVYVAVALEVDPNWNKVGQLSSAQ